MSAECCNEVSYEGKSYNKNVKKVDLENLELSFDATYGCWKLANFSNAYGYKYSVDVDGVNDNILCSKYSPENGTEVLQTHSKDNTLVIGSSGTLWIYNGSSTTQPSGDLYFELATPTETDISEYIDSDVIEVSAGGHLEFENEDDMGVPYSATYQCEPETQGEGE